MPIEHNVSVSCVEVMFVMGSLCKVHRAAPYGLVMYADTYILIILAMNGMFRISAARRCGSPHERAQLGDNALVCDLPPCGVPVAKWGPGRNVDASTSK